MVSRKKRIITIIIIIVAVLLVLAAIGAGIYFGVFTSRGSAYTVPRVDLSVEPENVPDDLKYLYDLTVVDEGDGGESYLAHPDSILMPTDEGEALYTFYVCGHGKGAIAVKSSTDGGLTYSERITDIPSSWAKSEETPTVYRLDFADGKTRFLLVSACPKWAGYKEGNGFCASVTDSDGNWTEFERFYGKGEDPHLYPIVAMSSLIHLKENGSYVDKWMGFFHDNQFRLFSTVLTFDSDGNMQWSVPQEFLKNSYDSNGKTIDQRLKAKGVNLCELLVIRNESGNGDVLCMIGRSNTKLINSLMAFSYDEGKTWSELKEVPPELNGERHKAVYDGNRLFIAFRSIERDPKLLKEYKATKFVSESWVAWVGTFEALTDWYYNGHAEGTYRVKLAHMYLDGQTEPCGNANADTGYSGVTLVDGYIVVSTYGRAIAGSDKTVIVSKRIKLSDLDRLNSFLGNIDA